MEMMDKSSPLREETTSKKVKFKELTLEDKYPETTPQPQIMEPQEPETKWLPLKQPLGMDLVKDRDKAKDMDKDKDKPATERQPLPLPIKINL